MQLWCCDFCVHITMSTLVGSCGYFLLWHLRKTLKQAIAVGIASIATPGHGTSHASKSSRCGGPLLEWVSGYLLNVFIVFPCFFFGNWKFLQEILTLTLHHEIQRRSWSVHCLHCLRRRSLVIYQKIEIFPQVFNSAGHFEHLILLMDKVVYHLRKKDQNCVHNQDFVHRSGGFGDTFSPVFEDIRRFPLPLLFSQPGFPVPVKVLPEVGGQEVVFAKCVKSHGTRMIKHCMVSTLFPYMYTYIEIGSHAHIERCARIRLWILFTVI